MYALRFGSPLFMWISFCLLITFIILRFVMRKKGAMYVSSLSRLLIMRGFTCSLWPSRILISMKIVLFFLLFLSCSKFQVVDIVTPMHVEGIDIALVLDASGSMQFADYGNSNKTRFDIAKDEAVRFVKKRINDSIALIIFGNDAVSRIPLTHDKNMVERMIKELSLGDIDPNGTKLATAMLSAANRLKRSPAKSKIMILLTDGAPSEGDIDPKAAIDIIKKLGIKVYTIGIGSEKEDYFIHPLYGMVAKPQVNKQLLEHIALNTGGRSFMAHNAQDMRVIYDDIDRLERTEKAVPFINKSYDFFWYIGWILLAIWIFDVCMTTLVWVGL